jgi:hypothetical protein
VAAWGTDRCPTYRRERAGVMVSGLIAAGLLVLVAVLVILNGDGRD